jgi:hypothetical protein
MEDVTPFFEKQDPGGALCLERIALGTPCPGSAGVLACYLTYSSTASRLRRLAGKNDALHDRAKTILLAAHGATLQ